MNKRGQIAILGILTCLWMSLGDSQDFEAISFSADEITRIKSLSPLPDIPPSPTNAFADNPKAAHFGQLLFFESRLSANGKIACATCHDPALGFSDGQAYSTGLGITDRHSPTILNLAYQRWFFWDGRADSIWAQSLQPLLRESEMGSTPAAMLKVIAGDSVLRHAYEAVFGSISEANTPVEAKQDEFLAQLGKSLEAYQRQIISKDSPFDKLVAEGAGKKNSSISESAQRGLKLFVGNGKCILCHSGPTFSDGEFHNIGLSELSDKKPDPGRFTGIREVKADRFNGLGKFSDKRDSQANTKIRYVVQKMSNLGEFKTPTLRHIAKTAPYMHDGRFSTLREVLDYYSDLPGEPSYGHREETLQALHFTEGEKDDLEAFLRTLTGVPVAMHLTERPIAPIPE